MHIVAQYADVEKEAWLTKDGELSGRADLVKGNSVWEIKHAANSPGERTVAAAAQAISYLGSTTIRTKELVTTLGEAGAFSGTFPIAVYDSAYEVSYTTPAPGAVLYTVKEVTAHNSQCTKPTYIPIKAAVFDNSRFLISTPRFGCENALSYPYERRK